MSDDRPLDVLMAATGEPIRVRLKDGEQYRGTLVSIDQHMNLVLDPPAESGGDEAATDEEAVDNTTVIRGDNVVTIEP
jgi:small nuclear ribonucleoprotein